MGATTGAEREAETEAEAGGTVEDRRIVVVGTGQAGLATGYFLKRHGLDFVMVADDERVGDPWRERWDSLELFTPAFYDGLPGMAFPADDPDHLPTKDEVADYLEAYAREFDLPVRLGVRVTRLERANGAFRLDTSDGELRASHVVVATGAHRHPDLPPFADELPDGTVSCHSSEYRNPDQLRDGDVLVVGAGNSGTQIAAEIAADDPDRRVWLAGRDTGRIPRRLLGRDIYRWLAPTLLRVRRTSFLGRRLYDRMASRGDPVFRPEFERMQEAGVERVGRIEGVTDGRPVSEDGERFDVDNVVWCTGFAPSFPWIDLNAFDGDGRPRHTRGVVEDEPGLYFVGLPWLHRPSSSLLGGVGRDAEYVVAHIRERVT